MSNRSFKLAVIGNPIAHSLSPPIHLAFGASLGLDVAYDRISAPLISEDETGFENTVKQFFAAGGHGLNVTVPFKEVAFKLCKKLSKQAQAAQAVNTLFMKEGELHGDNTDGVGLVNAISDLAQKHPSWQLKNANIAILGAGGACRGVLLPLLNAGVANITLANRTRNKAEKLVDDIVLATNAKNTFSVSSIEHLTGNFDIIINATSSSLHGQKLALNSRLNTNCAYDMVYTKEDKLTPFLQHFASKTTELADGFSMLIGQAAVSFNIWTEHQPDLQDTKLSKDLASILT